MIKDIQFMKFTETDLNRLATTKILNNYIEPAPNDERHHQTQVVFYPKESYFNLRGYGRQRHLDHVTIEQALKYIHQDFHEDAIKHFNILKDCAVDNYQFYIVAQSFYGYHNYGVLMVTLFAEYDEDTDNIVRYTGMVTDVTGEVYDRRINIKFKHKALFLEEQFKTALWSVDPDGLMLYCDKVGHDNFYHDYNSSDFIELVYPESQAMIRKIFIDMNARCCNTSIFLLHIRYQDDSEHYLQCKTDKLLNDQGEIFRYLIYSFDVTEQKKAEVKNKMVTEHMHKMMEETGIALFYYTPGSEKLHMEDPLADSRLLNITIDDYIKRVYEDDRVLFKDVFDHCDKRNLDRQEFTYRQMPYSDNTYHRFRNIVLPVFEDNGDLQMYGFIRIDVTHEYNNQAIFNYAQNVGKIGAWTRDLITGKNEWTDEMYRIFDISKKDQANSFDKISKLLFKEDQVYMTNCMRNIANIRENDPVFNFRIRTENDKLKYLEMRVHIDRNQEQIPVFAYGTLADVTDHEKLAMEKEKAYTLMHTVLRHFPSLVFVKDIEDDYRIVAANEAYAQFFGKKLDDIEGKSLKEYSKNSETVQFDQSDREAEKYTANHPLVEFYCHTNADGERHYYQKIKFAQMVSGRNLLICTATDVTELHDAKNKAEESDRLKSAFLANMSHEIRTPLNAIVGFSDIIVNNTNPEENELFKKIIHDNSDNLLRLINDILDISKLEANSMKFSFTEFKLCDMMREIYMSMKEQFEAKGIELVGSKAPLVNCTVYQDRVRVAEIVNNFLTNAYKHTSKGCVRISMAFMKERFRISVADTGTGIAKENLKTIFNRFEKLNEFKEGTGLGLAISQGLTKALGGEIGVESELGKGSTFWVELPIRAKEIK